MFVCATNRKGSNESLHRIGRASVGDSHGGGVPGGGGAGGAAHRGPPNAGNGPDVDSRSETSSFAESAIRNSEDVSYSTFFLYFLYFFYFFLTFY